MFKRVGSGILMASVVEGSQLRQRDDGGDLISFHDVDFSTIADVYEFWKSHDQAKFDERIKELEESEPRLVSDILAYAATADDSELVRHLLDLRVDPNVPTSRNHLPICLAVKSACLSSVRALLRHENAADMCAIDPETGLPAGRVVMVLKDDFKRCRMNKMLLHYYMEQTKGQAIRLPPPPTLDEVSPEERPHMVRRLLEAHDMVRDVDPKLASALFAKPAQ